jgi:long-chain acyl-CoA synthetase
MNAVIKTAYNLKNRKALKYPHHMVRWADFLKSKVVSAKPAVRGKDDPAVIIYSGGTTGKSKGIVLSNLCFNSLSTQCYAVCKEARPGNSILSALPIFHGFGLCVSIHVPLTLGLKCILLPKINVGELNSIIKKKKPNLLPAIPTMLNAMAKTPPISPTSLSSVKVILSGGDYLSDSVREKVLSYFKAGGADTHIQVGYGLSEATAFIAATSDNIAETDNIGIPNPDNIIKICDPDTNEEMPDGEIGEICVNGPTVMMGYINEKEETENAIRRHSDGITYLHTGDLGFMKDGVLHFTSRLKRMIISNGYNIYPTELENIINKCKYVASNVVVGVKDKVRQEAPKVVIVLKNGVQRTAEIEKEIVDFCKKNIAKNAQPTEYEFTDALPTTKIGKINYRQFENKEIENDK